MDEDIDGGTDDVFDVGEYSPVKGMNEQRWTSLCPDKSVASDFETPRSHEIKDESGVISKGLCVRSALSSGFIN